MSVRAFRTDRGLVQSARVRRSCFVNYRMSTLKLSQQINKDTKTADSLMKLDVTSQNPQINTVVHEVLTIHPASRGDLKLPFMRQCHV
jgi:hypothetical protein